MNSALQGFITVMEKRYQNASTHPYRLVCCREGLVQFIKTGLLNGNIANFPPFSLSERVAILQALRDRISKSDGMLSVLILKDSILSDGTIIGVNKDKGLLIDFGVVRQKGFSQNVLLHCPALSSLMVEYAYSDALEKRAYSHDETLSLIEDLLKRIRKV